MKTKSMLLASLAVLALGAVRGNGAEVSVSLFYDALEPHGEWIEAGDYGYVWTPRGVDNDWRPYTDGQWAYTDAGWTWVSEEPYSWAVYHYGRWVQLENVGWSWVPDTEWGPAWVSWRHSDRYVGWAPLPPESRETIRVGVNLGNWVDAYYDIGPTYYSFVEVRNLGAPRLRAVVLPPRENITIIQQTTNITNVVVRNNIVVNEGPQYDVVVRQTAQPIRRLKLNREVDIGDVKTVQGERFRTRVQGDSLNIPAPRFQAAAAGAALAPKKVARRVETVSVNRGWKNAGDNQKVEAFRTKLQTEAKPPANLPPVAHRDRGDRQDALGADRPTARTDADADSSTRPAGAPTREGRTPGNSSRPTAGTSQNPAEDPSRPTADTTAPADSTREPGANRPGRVRRVPGDKNRPDATAGDQTDSTRPPDGTKDKNQPGAAAGATPDAGDREKARQGKMGDRRNPAEAPMPKRDADPAKTTNPTEKDADSARPATSDPTAPKRPDTDSQRPGAPDRPGVRGAGGAPPTEKRSGADRPGADRPQGGNRPDSPARPDAGAGNPAGDRPEGARAGKPREDRPQGAREAAGPGGTDRPEGARVGSGQSEHPRPGAGGGEAPHGGGVQPSAGDKPEKGQQPGKEKKAGE